VLSYCATDLTGKCDRAALGWVNSFSFFDLARLLVVSRIFRTFDQATAPVCMTCDW
jgi:hypothetical protein